MLLGRNDAAFLQQMRDHAFQQVTPAVQRGRRRGYSGPHHEPRRCASEQAPACRLQHEPRLSPSSDDANTQSALQPELGPMEGDWRERTSLLVGSEGICKLADARVLVVGLGGVGAYAAEFLAR